MNEAKQLSDDVVVVVVVDETISCEYLSDNSCVGVNGAKKKRVYTWGELQSPQFGIT